MGASGTQCSAGMPVGGGGGGALGGGSTAPNGSAPAAPAVGGSTGGSPPEAGSAPAAATHRRSASDNRRSNKPIMEKRRRARINNCLNELKALILDATKKDPARHSKLEKADILEMTVRHLETLRRQRAALSAAADPAVLNKYKAGFSECAAEVSRFLMRHADASTEGATPSASSADQHFKRRLLSHLTHCLNGVSSTDEASSQTPGVQRSSSDSVEPMDDSPPRHSLPPLAPKQSPPPSGGAAPQATSALFAAAGLQLVPTRLANGDIALVLPSQHANHACRTQQPPLSTTPSSLSSSSSQPASPGSPPPLVVAFPSRTASTASCSSSASSTSSVSPVAFDRPTAFALTVPRPSPARVRAVKPVAVVAGSPAACAVPPVAIEGVLLGCTRPLSPPLQKPLSLVIRREESRDEDCPWRPW